jgi:hypothetical protein
MATMRQDARHPQRHRPRPSALVRDPTPTRRMIPITQRLLNSGSLPRACLCPFEHMADAEPNEPDESRQLNGLEVRQVSGAERRAVRRRRGRGPGRAAAG